ncbi:hypothetical protein GPECTOR_12g346 [Gonium pectorale]|uniref:Large ribosomal subunit protein uL30m n=1 Tax=Gonium pectorale TaxID=33097 RepID=A0A150GNK3_GONPE|nr:hypothetical protein GPECTOR_12g346 [Gonium pectorale]|eukprot:KXZ51384.1 hypothetical protein GPECTOR_12g346 [Gonium pectorale]
MSEGAAQVVKSLFVTLRRGYAGTPWFHRRVLEALGLKHRHQCVEKPNNHSIRGMLAKVPHLVIVETDRMRYLREVKSHHEQLPRLPWVLHHDPPHPAAAAAPPPAARATALTADGGATSPPAAPLPPPAPPRFTPFALKSLKEHVDAVGLDGFEASRGRPAPPRPYFQELARRYKVKILTERGLYGSDSRNQHAQSLQPKAYRRRVGIRD